MKINWKRIIQIIAALVLIAAVELNAHIHVSYAESMPRTPDVASGRVHLVTVNHGVRVYVSKNEKLKKEIMERIGFVAAFISVLLIGVLQRKGSSSTSRSTLEA
jgi:hypothetical protein